MGRRPRFASDPMPFFGGRPATPQPLGPSEVELVKIFIAGSRQRVSDWLGFDLVDSFDGVEFKFISPNGQPGLDAAKFKTPKGTVKI